MVATQIVVSDVVEVSRVALEGGSFNICGDSVVTEELFPQSLETDDLCISEREGDVGPGDTHSCSHEAQDRPLQPLQNARFELIVVMVGMEARVLAIANKMMLTFVSHLAFGSVPTNLKYKKERGTYRQTRTTLEAGEKYRHEQFQM